MPDTAIRSAADPSPRTLEQMYREIKSLEDKITIRFDSYDKAIELLQDTADRQPTPGLVMASVHSLRELMVANSQAARELVDAKFEGNKTALDAALKTQKEASDKIETNFTRQFDNLASIIEAKTKSLDDKISDNKDRINTSEGRTKGVGDSWGVLLGVASLIGVAIVAASFIIARAG